MKLTISDNRKIHQIQEEFSRIFPYLKIEFFNEPHAPGMPSPRSTMKRLHSTLALCRSIHTNGTLTVVPEMTVSDLEQNFTNLYGLSVQVFRKSGKVWLETTATDKWTLEKQNQQGKELAEYYENKNAD